jgi:hypothetical protein
MTAKRENAGSIKSILLISDDDDDDRQVFEVSTQDAKLSVYLTKCIKSGMKEVKLNFPNDQLALITVYLELHAGVEPAAIPKPLHHPTMAKNCGEKDGMFIDDLWKVSPYKVCDLLVYSEALQIRSLRNLCCARIGLAVKGHSILQAIQNLRDPSEQDQ